MSEQVSSEKGNKEADGKVADGNAAGGSADDKKVTEKASEIAQRQMAEQKAAKAIATMEKLEERFNSDPEFAEEFNRIWRGMKKDAAAAAAGKESSDDSDDDDPIVQMRKEIASLKSDLTKKSTEVDELRNTFGYDKISARREGINDRYDAKFKEMAVGAGYDVKSDAFETLYSDILRETRSLAAKFGLTAEDGSPDPLKNYNEGFIKEAFDNVIERHKRSGMYDGVARKRRMEEEKRQREQPKDELSKFFDPSKLKTRSDRAAALEKAFRHKFPGMKIV